MEGRTILGRVVHQQGDTGQTVTLDDVLTWARGLPAHVCDSDPRMVPTTPWGDLRCPVCDVVVPYVDWRHARRVKRRTRKVRQNRSSGSNPRSTTLAPHD